MVRNDSSAADFWGHVQNCVQLRFRLTQCMTLAAVLLTLLPCVFMASGCLNNYDGHGISNVAVADAGHHHGLPSAAEGAINQAKRLADKQESEFNHHLAGLFIVAAGMLILGQERLARRWPSAKYAWPLCFLVAGSSFCCSAILRFGLGARRVCTTL